MHRGLTEKKTTVTNKNTGSDNDKDTKQDNESEPEHDTVAVESPCQ